MGHLNLPASKRNARQWKLLDIVSATFFGLVFVFFLLVFTPLGDSLAASGRQALLMSTSDPHQRQRLVALIEAGHHLKPIESCPADSVDHMPCEDPRRNSQLSREMNFYRERHCPLPAETPLCLIPPPPGYKIPVPWPESLSKVSISFASYPFYSILIYFGKLELHLVELSCYSSVKEHHVIILCTVQIWHANMPYNKIADRKGHQGWMKESGPYFTFPGGGTMFANGADKYIYKLKQYIPISGGTLRTALDMGCGVRTRVSLLSVCFSLLAVLRFEDLFSFRLLVLGDLCFPRTF